MKTHLHGLVKALFALMLAGCPDFALALSDISKISAGELHTCALTTAGGVKCWGANQDGQLGDGTTIQRLTPVDVSGLTSGATAISAGATHTCALTTTRGVKCWGANQYGQLGDGTRTQRLTPVDVNGLTNFVTAISASKSHVCALTTAGGVKCWGNNSAGQLGDGTRTQRLTPVDVSGLASGVAAISAGYYGTCALTTAGGVKCWGSNGVGQLGDGTTTDRLTPGDVNGLTSGVTSISAGYLSSCASVAAGRVVCWGANDYGVLGDGTTTDRYTPGDVSGLTSGVTATSAPQYYHTCARTAAGGVKCWGTNWNGRLGDGTKTTHLTPEDVTGLTSFVQAISAGSEHTCALTTAGRVKCWGASTFGQLGDGTTGDRYTPVDVGRRYRLSGTILLAGSGFAEVSVEGEVLGTQTTDQNGSFLFDGISDGTDYTLTPTKTGYTFTPSSVSSTIAADTTEDFTASILTYTISGTVLAGDSPLSGVGIDGGALGTQLTDAYGQYSFAALPYGTSYLLTPSKIGYTFAPVSSGGSLTVNAAVDFSASLLPTPTSTPTPTATPTPGYTDTSPPSVNALKAKGKAGAVISLTYEVSDDSGVTKESVRVFRRGKVIKSINTGFAQIPVNGKRRVRYWLRRKKAKHKFCVVAADQAKNVSAESCAKLRIILETSVK